MNKKRVGKRILVIIIVMVVLLSVGGGIWWLFNSGLFVNSNQVSTSKEVCGPDVVNRYNAAMYYQPRNGSSESSIDEQGVKDLAADIKSKKNFEIDPTCQTIIFWSAVRVDNYNEAHKAYDALINLYKKRFFVDSNLRSNQPLFTYEKTLNGLTGSGFKNENIFGE